MVKGRVTYNTGQQERGRQPVPPVVVWSAVVQYEVESFEKALKFDIVVLESKTIHP